MRRRVLWVVNCALVLIIAILVVHIIGVRFPSVGKVRALVDAEPPACFVGYRGVFSAVSLDDCCRGVAEQLSCSFEKNVINSIRTDFSCSTGHGDVLSFRLNANAKAWCSERGYVP